MRYTIKFATYTQDDEFLDFFLDKGICDDKNRCEFLREKLKNFYPEYENEKIK